MPKESTRGLEPGSSAPAFSLLEPSTGKKVSSTDFTGKPLLVTFITNDCVTVSLIREEFLRFAREYQEKGLEIVAINPNEGGGVAEMRDDVVRFGYSFPYLFDETQAVSRQYQAVCTPDFFIFDASHKLYYLGRFDETRPGNNKIPDGVDLRAAADALLQGKEAPAEQNPSFGCSIVWNTNISTTDDAF